MSEDYYKVLGIKRNATDAEVQRAYREMARKYHPDLNPDDAKAKEKFQAVQRAYEVLNDSEKRELYNRYGSKFDSMGGSGGGPAGGGFPGGGFSGGAAGDINLEELLRQGFGGGADGGSGGFSDLFRQFGRGAGTRTNTRKVNGKNLRHQLEVPFQTAVLGGEARINVQRQGGKLETIDVRIPAGIEDGRKIRLRGQGEPSPNGGEPGDILITVRTAAHPWFQRRGRNLEIRVPITLSEAVNGATIDVPTPQGTISLKVPPGTSSGKKLRVKGFGVAAKDGAGDLYAEVLIMVPEEIPDEVADRVRELNLGPSSPRSDLKW